MHKAIYLEGRLRLTIKPDGPILIKAGETGSADPAAPDMAFVRTSSEGAAHGVYLPGSSLKGAVRAHAERICRTLDQEGRNPDDDNPPLADNPLGKGDNYGGLSDMRFNSGRYVEKHRNQWSDQATGQQTAMAYRRSSFTSQMFGHTGLAGRIRFADAYGSKISLEERNGVAIDRIYGSVAFGPFNYEVVTKGEFPTTIDFKNITLAQLGLLGLVMRDLSDGRLPIGFGKSRGLGRVTATMDELTLRYPLCMRSGDMLLLGRRPIAATTHLAGLGAFAPGDEYGLSQDDTADLSAGLAYDDDPVGIGVMLHTDDQTLIRAVFQSCMRPWKQRLGLDV